MNIFETLFTKATKQYSNFGMNNNVQGSIPGFGALTPIYYSTVLPTDSWKIAHNMIVKLPPLVAPAFTRIKAVINSYYCSYPMVWNYWNNFISDRPDDVYLNARNISNYKGRYVEPCVSMDWIAVICKIAYGNVMFFGSAPNTIQFKTLCPTVKDTERSCEYYESVVWSYNDGLRYVERTINNPAATAPAGYAFDSSMIELIKVDGYSGTNTSVETYSSEYGFFNSISMLIYLCQSCVRNLEALGVPCTDIASTPVGFYSPNYVAERGDGHEFWNSRFLNLLPFMCMSKTWNIYYRNNSVQSPELDYSDVNGVIFADPSAGTYSLGDTGETVSKNLVASWTSHYPSKSYNWRIKLNCLPPNANTSESKALSPYYYDVNSERSLFAVLTGYNLKFCIKRDLLNNHASDYTDNNVILPDYYNGLLVQKFRNFEDDYFTSATLDPMEGHSSLNVPSTLEELRNVSKLEEFLERNAFARDFYSWMQANFGVSPNSIVNQRPLLLGTKVVPVQIGEQLQTSQSTDSSPLGERGGTAEGYGNGSTCDHSFNEHGFIFSWLSFVLDSQYMQGMPHELNTHLQMDYPFSDFANLGPEVLPADQVYFASTFWQSGTSFRSSSGNLSVGYVTDQVSERSNLPYGVRSELTFPNMVFGYTPRYTKWKFKQDVVFGEFRRSLEYWHTFRHFDQAPVISHNFVSYENVGYVSNLNRIFAVVNDNADKFWVDIFNNASVRRYLPVVPNPTLN